MTKRHAIRLQTEPTGLYIGLMTGTSLDGVDAVLCQFAPQFRVLARHSIDYPSSLRSAMLALMRSGPDELHRAALASQGLVQAYCEGVQALLRAQGLQARDITAIGAHGQTVRHAPNAGYSWQLNQPSLLAHALQIAVVADFRAADLAAGGQGAPLVPAFHAALFRDPRRWRVIVNLGGIANLTLLPPQENPSQPLLGFDTGPANVLMDGWAERHGQGRYDEQGRWAAGGKVIDELLAALMATPYLRQAPPKSTGRELFNLEWLDQHQPGRWPAQDVQTTLCEFTARTVADGVRQGLAQMLGASGSTETSAQTECALYVCGGGAYNTTLLQRLQALLPAYPVSTTAELGLDPMAVEAAAFAWLAHQTCSHAPGNLPSATGASRPKILGGIFLPS